MKSRREFLTHTSIGVAAAALLPSCQSPAPAAVTAPPPAAPIKLGLASYTVRKFDLDKALAMVARLGLRRMVFKDAHLPLNAPDEQIRATIAKARAKGIEVYGCGTVYMKTPAEVEQAFHYAQTAGMKMIIGAPNVELLPLVEQKVKATDIWLAIHNHGPDNPLYPSPLDAYALVKNMDRRMGLCMDIGHTQRLGQDPIAVFKTCFDRVFDVHIKDVSAPTKAGKTVEIGRGIIDMVGFLRTVVALGYAHTLDFEHEKDDTDPLPGVAESIGYVRGVLKMLNA
jgi:sugar phosphate isomerase/epimerase